MKDAKPEVFDRLLKVAEDPAAAWELFTRRDWPELFRLLNVAADLPRLTSNRSLAALPAGAWPQLNEVATDLANLQLLIDRPRVPADAQIAECHSVSHSEVAREQLAATHCTHVDFLLSSNQQAKLNLCIAALAEHHLGRWGQLERQEAPGLFEIFDEALSNELFQQLTGFIHGRDTYTLTLSLQDLDVAGIGWHRDLYWPKEWVGEDVFAVLYSLGMDSPEKGGAFLHYVPWDNSLLATYRKHHQATILWNSRDDSGRILHAVSNYHTADTSRHLIILQCLRRSA